MTKSIWWRLAVVLFVILGALFVLIPSYKFYRLSEEELERMSPSEVSSLRSRSFHLGLDLRGGTHLVLEVDESKLTEDQRKDATDRAMEKIRNRIDEFGVAEPIIQKQGRSRIVVQLPGVDAERAKELVKRTAFLEFRLVEDPVEVQASIQRMDEAAKALDLRAGAIESLTAPVEVTEDAEDSTLAGLFAARSDDSTAALGLGPESKTENPLASRIYILDSGVCSVRLDEEFVVKRYLSEATIQRAMGRQADFVWGERFTAQDGTEFRRLYLLKTDPKVSGEALSNAQIGIDYDDGSAGVDFFLNRRGGKQFGRITRDNVGKLLAIVLDNVVQSAPRINSEIRTRGQITGSFTEDEARDLAVVLRTGALPAPVTISEERSVGPSLGQDSIRRGVRAALFGLGIVILFMIFYYRACGILSDFALILNIFLILGGLALFRATLTLPGIAGVILTIGMAVDANVLIFERIREELRAGKTVGAAISGGYSRAFLTILDSNITTLLTALILLQFGTGAIKGFAVTLSMGIVFSMFTALFVTRLILDMITARFTLKKLSI